MAKPIPFGTKVQRVLSVSMAMVIPLGTAHIVYNYFKIRSDRLKREAQPGYQEELKKRMAKGTQQRAEPALVDAPGSVQAQMAASMAVVNSSASEREPVSARPKPVADSPKTPPTS